MRRPTRRKAGGDPVTDRRLLTAPEVSEILMLSVDNDYKLAREGRIPHLRFGRVLLFRAEAIVRWLEQEERGNGQSV
jgi:excisionase family DNA binding protein